MSSGLVIWHNPRCGKSREALRLIEERGLKVEIVRYLDMPPKPSEIRGVLEKLGCGPRDILRSKEAVYEALGLDDPALSDGALIQAMAENPILIERPIVIRGKRAIIARPPEKLRDFLD